MSLWPQTGASRGYGRVTFRTEEAAAKAVYQADGTVVCGSEISVTLVEYMELGTPRPRLEPDPVPEPRLEPEPVRIYK